MGHHCFSIGPKTQTWWRTLRPCFISSFSELFSTVSIEKSKMHQPIRGQDGYLDFPIGPKKTQTWSKTKSACILSIFVDFGEVEKKLKM